MWHWQSLVGNYSTGQLKSVLNQRMKQLEGEVALIVSRQLGVTTFTASDTTPSVGGGSIFKTNNSGATSITTFDNGRNGQHVIVIFGDANTTLVNSATLEVSGDANFTGAAGDTKTFVLDGTVWREVSQPAVWG